MAAGHVDPSITGDTIRQREVLAAIRARGLSLHRLHGDSRAVRLSGPGLHVIASDLAALALSDLEPPSGAEIQARVRQLNEDR
jgi:hypothetical protein